MSPHGTVCISKIDIVTNMVSMAPHYYVLVKFSNLKTTISDFRFEFNPMEIAQAEVHKDLANSFDFNNRGKLELRKVLDFEKNVKNSFVVQMNESYSWSNVIKLDLRFFGIELGDSSTVDKSGDLKFTHEVEHVVKGSNEVLIGAREHVIASAYIKYIRNKMIPFTATTKITGHIGNDIELGLKSQNFSGTIIEVGADYVTYEVSGFIKASYYVGTSMTVENVGE